MNEIEVFYRGCRLIGGQVTRDHWSIVAYQDGRRVTASGGETQEEAIEKAKTKIDEKFEEKTK